MKEKLKVILKLLFSDVRQALVALAVAALVSLPPVYYGIMSAPTPVWLSVLLLLLCLLSIYFVFRLYKLSEIPRIQEELYEAYGVYWNKDFKKRCLRCRWPLKNSTEKHGPSVFFCSRCDTKHALQDDLGNPLNERGAIELIKSIGEWPH